MFTPLKKALILYALFAAFSVQAMAPQEFLNWYSPLAKQESSLSGIPASIIMAQAIFESNWGGSQLAKNANNFFGIKCKDNWQGHTYYHRDDDYVRGKLVASCFRSYPDIASSFRDHGQFLRSRERYRSLFQLPSTDYRNWAVGLQKAGYATNPQYAQRLINLIEKYELYRLDESFLKETTYKPAAHNNQITLSSNIPKSVRLPEDYFPGYYTRRNIQNNRN